LAFVIADRRPTGKALFGRESHALRIALIGLQARGFDLIAGPDGWVTPAERMRLATAIAGERTRSAEDSEIASAHGVRKIHGDALEREAIAAALSGTGVITIRSRRVRLSYSKVGT
jgi:hypothetical protein